MRNARMINTGTVFYNTIHISIVKNQVYNFTQEPIRYLSYMGFALPYTSNK